MGRTTRDAPAPSSTALRARRYHDLAMAESLVERLKAVPQRAGVYTFRNARGEAIYVGKAASLRDRMRSYLDRKSVV